MDRSRSELERSLSLVRATLESTMDGILIVGLDAHIVDCNQKFVSMWKIPPEVMSSGDENRALGVVLDQVIDPDGLAKLVTKLYDNIEEAGDLGEIYFKDGRVFERYSQPHRLGDQIVGRVWSFRDITERKRNEEILRLREQAIESSPNGILITEVVNRDQPIIYVNPAFERITGYKKEEVIGRDCRFLQGMDKDQPAISRIRLALQEKKEVHVAIRNYRKDGSMFWNQLNVAPVFDANNNVKHFVGIVIDITNQKTLENQLLHQATHDMLTGLPNRSLLLDRIQQDIIQLKHNHLMIGVLFIDLDQFKLINDSLGHMVGDKLLKLVADRLVLATDERTTVTRLGGDEFVIILPALEMESVAYNHANKVLDELAKPFDVDGKILNITTSIGISFYPRDGQDADTLLKSADMSMYLAKENGRNNFKVYTEELNRSITKRMMLENNLRSALERNEFLLYYQPMVNIETNDNVIVGAEALIRWLHPELGLVAPQEFIPITEEDGLIIPIGKWVFETACAQLKKWNDAGLNDLTIAVNFSCRQLQQPDVIDMVDTVIRSAQIDPKQIELEITESTLLENTEEILDKLYQLKKIGVKLSIDDFGTGYSSLNYLRKFPVTKIKIDRSFIQDATCNEDNAAIAIAIIKLSHSLKLRVIAEGVETEDQLAFLRKNQCDEVQGYYFSKPINPDDFLTLLRKNRKHNMEEIS